MVSQRSNFTSVCTLKSLISEVTPSATQFFERSYKIRHLLCLPASQEFSIITEDSDQAKQGFVVRKYYPDTLLPRGSQGNMNYWPKSED